MKKTAYSTAFLCFIATIIVMSCQKDYNSNSHPVTTDTTTVSLDQLFTEFRSTPQTLSVTAGTDVVVYGAKGTRLHFYTNSFKDAAGNIITSGTVTLKLDEMYKVGDMIQNRANTTTDDDQPLMSGGQINITATMGGTEVFANKYGIGFKQPAASSQPMILYYAETPQTDSAIRWTSADTTKTGTGSGGTTVVNTEFYYLFDSCSKFWFVNCDHPFTSTWPKSYSRIILPDTSFSRKNTEVYICFPLFNCVLSNAYVYGATTGNDIKGIYYAPIGRFYKLVAMTNNKGKYFYFETSGTMPSDTLVINAVMLPTTKEAIKSKLYAL